MVKVQFEMKINHKRQKIQNKQGGVLSVVISWTKIILE